MIEVAVQRAFHELQTLESAHQREVPAEYVQASHNLESTSARSHRARGADATGGLEVEFERFAGFYWKALDVEVKRRFEPTLVWAEVQGLIKGSEQALASGRRQLTREQYEELNQQRYPAFAHFWLGAKSQTNSMCSLRHSHKVAGSHRQVFNRDRARLYDLFLNYEQIKTGIRPFHRSCTICHAMSGPDIASASFRQRRLGRSRPRLLAMESPAGCPGPLSISLPLYSKCPLHSANREAGATRATRYRCRRLRISQTSSMLTRSKICRPAGALAVRFGSLIVGGVWQDACHSVAAEAAWWLLHGLRRHRAGLN
eukprot:2618615-Rhodomonas_salina.1